MLVKSFEINVPDVKIIAKRYNNPAICGRTKSMAIVEHIGKDVLNNYMDVKLGDIILHNNNVASVDDTIILNYEDIMGKVKFEREGQTE